jgi:hypothetical protein
MLARLQQQSSISPASAQIPSSSEQTVKWTNDQLDSLVAPIALYPDPLLAQVLAASTYPLEIVQLQQWLAKHKDLKDQTLVDAVKKEDWDPSVQAMAPLPDVLKQLAENIKWTSELGNAMLVQQSEVMDAVQRMRMRAKDSGKLTSTEQMKVETKVVESKSVVVIEQANPEVVYIPSYNPAVVWGPAVYPYPPVYYPPAGYYAAGMAISFGVGIAIGAAWGGGWGWGAGWGGNNTININRNNNFNRDSRTSIGSGNSWQHNPQHRGGAPYGDRATADRFGGTTRGDSLASRQSSARQSQLGGGRQQPGSVGSDRFGASAGNRMSSSGGSGDRVGSRQVPSSGSSRGSGAFGGASSTRGSSARASGQRGASSMGAARSGSFGGGGARRMGGGGRRR